MTPDEIAKVTEEWEAEQEETAYQRTKAALENAGGRIDTIRQIHRTYTVGNEFLRFSVPAVAPAPNVPNPLVPIAVDLWLGLWRYLKVATAIVAIVTVALIALAIR